MMFTRKDFLSTGQSTVEYLLLFAVMAAITMSILGSDKFKQIMGKDSEFFVALKNYMEYSYRHGAPGSRDISVTRTGGVHELYFNVEKGGTHFFTPLEEYPKN
ncbi:MAG: hypothetical protein A2381_14250 [Bdellovibrionales bacterium RIFOXYB1_FULL_37_110]|nr:MAG: hypothetical protein A2181_05485 [Bdellovibrionales bacterium RIFOXYA1_FULL_38_20]OFZ47825.1 MAG: hypothetical protein A2417_15245 [Bdellovibrionales bacterium RIFOXYC1_FULL_37_79]OFZ57572.1 MAG: hypothetical protein A2381_14250 [Bdellovibrionales bacterium RIFOXYB1_FULL_37_110]OFZ61640.1 MAG: hypothetical protein A2577_10650 [Bdellovibrionales bacterium RIFOXYD1_FULL_36_51]